jgi:RimJ/RimL family protein N-acetyltransferase
MEIPTLQTERLILRPFRPDDFASYAAMSADPEVMRYIAPPQDESTAFRSFCSVVGHWEVRGYGCWALEERSTGRFIGRAGLFKWGRFPEIEIGYLLERAAWGKGYAFEAAARSLRYAHERGLRGLMAVIEEGNAASIRVVERLGARLDREAMVDDHRLRFYIFRDPEDRGGTTSPS